MDADDLRLFQDTLRGVAQGQSGGELDAALADVGWRDALGDAPSVAAALFALQGELCVSSSALDDVLAVALGLEPAATTGVVLPPIGSYGPPGAVVGDQVVVRGLGSRRIAATNQIMVVVRHADGDFALTVTGAELDVRPIAGMDPAGGWVEISANLSLPPDRDRTSCVWSTVATAGQLALASELVGGSRAMLALARDHAVERIQFGAPIASFQAVRHRLADALYAVESADGAVAASWEEPSQYTAAMAKAIAGRSAKTVARHAQQVLAGMGFTSEHRFHHYFRRSLILDQLFGSSTALSEEIGAEVLRTGTLPPVRPL